MKPKYIIKQVPPEHAELAFYFDGDTFTPAAGGLEYTLFIVAYDRFRGYQSGINGDTWQRITDAAGEIMVGFDDAAQGLTDYDGNRITYKSIMTAAGIPYSPTKCHRLKEWYQYNEYSDDPQTIAQYLTITTGRPWTTASATGYCQGDHVTVIYCEHVYTMQDAEAAGEIYLGAASEYSITFPAEDGSEPETVCGYIIADCQAWRPEDAKRLVCECEGIDPADAVLMIPGKPRTVTTYEYEEVC